MTRFIALFAAVVLGGCAGSAGSQFPVAPTGAQSVVPAVQSLVEAQSRDASPATCDTSVHVLFHKGNSAFHLPRCAGWKGLIRYPGGGKISRWVVTSSVTNNFGVSAPPSGTAIFYMQMYLRYPRAPWPFANAGVSDTVTSSAFTSDHTYTLNVYKFIYNNQCPSSQCTWTLNIGTPQPGSHSITFSSPLNGALVDSGPGLGPVWQFVQN
jgi:hypothetical protein